jgi:hypothetical protein
VPPEKTVAIAEELAGEISVLAAKIKNPGPGRIRTGVFVFLRLGGN